MFELERLRRYDAGTFKNFVEWLWPVTGKRIRIEFEVKVGFLCNLILRTVVIQLTVSE